jgi:hypothetical protein
MTQHRPLPFFPRLANKLEAFRFISAGIAEELLMYVRVN